MVIANLAGFEPIRYLYNMLGDSGSVRSKSRRFDSPSLGRLLKVVSTADAAFPRSVVTYRRLRGIGHGPTHVDPSLVARPELRAFRYVGYHLALTPKCTSGLCLLVA
jgi:hypothetical protein